MTSALSSPATKPPEAATGSGTVIFAGSDFASGVACYRQNLPPGWPDETTGDFGQLGRTVQQLTPENLMKMLNGDLKALTPSAPSSAQDVLRRSLFRPPGRAQ